MKKRMITSCIFLVLCVICVYLGIVLFRDRNYNVISMVVAFLACVPFFLSFEKGKTHTRKLVLIAVMIAITVVSRLVFFALPGFKPVTAVVIITGIYFGSEAGFLTGAISALISNIFFGQGPWTPFQMLSWGLIGFVAGLLAKQLHEKRVLLYLYGAISGIAFSMLMDVWSTMTLDGGFNLTRYVVLMISSLPFMALYVVSNIVFLWILEKPMGKKLERIKIKYGI